MLSHSHSRRPRNRINKSNSVTNFKQPNPGYSKHFGVVNGTLIPFQILVGEGEDKATTLQAALPHHACNDYSSKINNESTANQNGIIADDIGGHMLNSSDVSSVVCEHQESKHGQTLHQVLKSNNNNNTILPPPQNHHSPRDGTRPDFRNEIPPSQWTNEEYRAYIDADDFLVQCSDDESFHFDGSDDETSSPYQNIDCHVRVGAKTRNNVLNKKKNDIAPTTAKTVQQIDAQTGRIIAKFSSGKQAAEALGISRSEISLCVNKKKSQCPKGFIWRFSDEYNQPPTNNYLDNQKRPEKCNATPTAMDKKDTTKRQPINFEAKLQTKTNTFLSTKAMQQVDANARVVTVADSTEKFAGMGEPVLFAAVPYNPYTLFTRPHTTNNNYGRIIGQQKSYQNNLNEKSSNTRTSTKAVQQIDADTKRVIAIHASGKEAAATVGIAQSEISLCANGHKSYCPKGYIWRFFNEYNQPATANNTVNQKGFEKCCATQTTKEKSKASEPNNTKTTPNANNAPPFTKSDLPASKTYQNSPQRKISSRGTNAFATYKDDVSLSGESSSVDEDDDDDSAYEDQPAGDEANNDNDDDDGVDLDFAVGFKRKKVRNESKHKTSSQPFGEKESLPVLASKTGPGLTSFFHHERNHSNVMSQIRIDTDEIVRTFATIQEAYTANRNCETLNNKSDFATTRPIKKIRLDLC